MEKIVLNEQQLVDAICLFQAKFRQVSPQEVEVELMYDDEEGFSAEALFMDKVMCTQQQISSLLFVYILKNN
ncbi:hypothetical protein UACE39S_00591 [Ureibacillus acetophenoni]